MDEALRIITDTIKEKSLVGLTYRAHAGKINQEEGLTVIIAEHEVEVIAEFADKVVLLEHGEITKIGTPQEVFPELVNKQSEIGVRVPQVTEFANLAPEKFQGTHPVTLSEAKESYIK